jgi:hypothetical protein
VRRGGVFAAIGALVLCAWFLRRAAHAEVARVQGPRAKAAAPADPRPATSGVSTETFEEKTAEDATVFAEREGRFKELYDEWRSHPEDAEATAETKRWLDGELAALGLQPSTGFLSCRQSLCRLGIGFEDLSDLLQLRRVALPEGREPEVTEPYVYGTTTVVIIYWSRESGKSGQR